MCPSPNAGESKQSLYNLTAVSELFVPQIILAVNIYWLFITATNSSVPVMSSYGI
jgi:hypothetical protein